MDKFSDWTVIVITNEQRKKALFDRVFLLSWRVMKMKWCLHRKIFVVAGAKKCNEHTWLEITDWKRGVFFVQNGSDWVWVRQILEWNLYRNVFPLYKIMCLFMWSERWSDLEKALSHILHWKGRSPVCFLLCLVNSSDLANFQPQPLNVQM